MSNYIENGTSAVDVIGEIIQATGNDAPEFPISTDSKIRMVANCQGSECNKEIDPTIVLTFGRDSVYVVCPDCLESIGD